MIMLLRHVSVKNCGVYRELWIFPNFPNTHCEKEAKTTLKISYNERNHSLVALVSKTRFGQLENGLFVTKYVSCIFKWFKTLYIQNSIFGFFCLFVFVVVVVVVCSNNPNLSCHLQQEAVNACCC